MSDAAPNANLLRMFLRRSRSSMVLAVVAGIVSGASTSVLIALINVKLSGADSSRWAWSFAAVCALRLLAGIGCHVLLIRLSQAAIFDLRVALCRTILAAPLRQLEVTGSHRLMGAFTEDMLSIANIVINLPYMFVNMIIVACCLAYVGWLSWAMLGGIAGCLLLGALSYYLPVLWANRRLRQARGLQDKLFAHFRALTEGLKQLKLHARRRQVFLEEILVPSADDVRRNNVAGVTIYSMAANWSRMLFFVYVGLLLWMAPTLMPRQGTELAGYVLVLLYMMAPVEAIMNTLPHLAQANVALRHVAELNLALQSTGQECGEHRVLANASTMELQLENVRYAYADGSSDREFALGPIDLVLNSGELVFLVGGNGSGKTTLAKLICGLYTPEQGHILLNGEPIDTHIRECYRQKFSVVFNDFHLFDSLLGQSDFGRDARARGYLDMLQLDHKLTVVDGVFSTTALSQGQRKRLALLVALMEDNPLYIFDEWAADQDPRFKHMFYDRILPDLKRRGKAVLVITHDDRYFDRADRIYKLDEGRLDEAKEPAGGNGMIAADEVRLKAG